MGRWYEVDERQHKATMRPRPRQTAAAAAATAAPSSHGQFRNSETWGFRFGRIVQLLIERVGRENQ